jgi:hypothetical protein
MATGSPRDEGETTTVGSGRSASIDRSDSRYRAMSRREMREGVRVQLTLSAVGVVGAFAFIGFGHVAFDVVALPVFVLSIVLLLRDGIVRRRPQLIATVDGMLLVAMLSVGVADVPEPTLAIGAFGLMIAGSGSFVIRDGAGRIIWLVIAVAVFAVGLAFSDMDAGLRAQGLYVACFAAIACAGGHVVAQRRRRRTMDMEALLRRQRHELRAAVRTLQAAEQTIDALEGVLPICAHCKRIRDAANEWVGVEKYLEERSRAQFSHGICPDCMNHYYPSLGFDQPG